MNQNVYSEQINMKVKILTIILVLSNCLSLAAQYSSNTFPKVGMPCPDFRLDGVKYFEKNQITLSDFKGKWLVIDLFSTGCKACFESFPKINKLQNELEGKLQFLLVGYKDAIIEDMYEAFRLRKNLNLPVAFDTTIFRKFGVYGVPHLMLIDPSGIVKSITTTLSKDEIEAFLKGKDPELVVKPNIDELRKRNQFYNQEKLLLIDGNGGADTSFLYRSILTKWSNGIVAFQRDFISHIDNNRVESIGQTLKTLYQKAYSDTTWNHPNHHPNCYGEFWPTPILELSDSSEFDVRNNSAKNKFNYSLCVPSSKADAQFLKETMQRDLKTYFGYDVTVETRLMPYWKLEATEAGKENLRTKGEPTKEIASPARTSLELINFPVQALINHLATLFYASPPFVDETGIKGNIDVKINAILMDFKEIKSALEKNGLLLSLEKKEMKVIVIRDKKN